MVNTIERVMARRQVQAMINADPVTVIPVRVSKVSDGAGGWVESPPTPRKPITGTIVPAKRRLTDMLVNTELGDVVRGPYIFLGPHDADLLRGDTFDWNGSTFEVKELEIDQEVSTTAQIDYLRGLKNERLTSGQ